MPRLIALLVCLAAAFGLFYIATATPRPLSAAAPTKTFSAGRAMADIAAMAQVPHPVGTAADDRVRDYLVTRMTALGLSPGVQREESHRSETFGGEFYVEGANVENVIGVLPGRNRSLPALVLMAHRDSVPGSPGAADDIAGVASALEIVRAIEAAGSPQRDVIVAITDAEESGLLGANAFFADDPLAAHAGFVINLERAGGGGRAAMFETGSTTAARSTCSHEPQGVRPARRCRSSCTNCCLTTPTLRSPKPGASPVSTTRSSAGNSTTIRRVRQSRPSTRVRFSIWAMKSWEPRKRSRSPRPCRSERRTGSMPMCWG